MCSAIKLRAVFCAIVLSGCSSGPDEFLFQGGTMGTTWSVKLISEESVEESDLQIGIQAVLDNVDSKMSNWVSSSDVSEFNMAGSGCWAVSPETLEVVALSQSISALSDGLFDATLEPLIELWGFGAEFRSDQIPEGEAVQQNLAMVGYQKLRINEGELCKDVDELFLNLSATAKGYAVDLTMEYLASLGYHDILVEVGGEIRGLGLNRNGEFWRVGIESPLDGLMSGAIQEEVSLENQALATSGDYRNYFMHEGVRYSHIIDARTGFPVPQELASVTVRHDSSAWADGWATALLAMGAEEGLELAEQQELAVYLILRTDSGFEVQTSSAW